MDTSNDAIAKKAIINEHNLNDPKPSQFTKHRGRSNSPPWRKLLVYNLERQAVEVRSEKNVDKEYCQAVKLPPKEKQVTIFMDAETETEPTIQSKGSQGQNNTELATLYLDRLSKYQKILRLLGMLSTTLYVMSAGPLSETSSQIAGMREL